MTSVVRSLLGIDPSVDNRDNTESRVGTGCSVLPRWGTKCESNVCIKGLRVARNDQHLGRNLRLRTVIPQLNGQRASPTDSNHSARCTAVDGFRMGSSVA